MRGVLAAIVAAALAVGGFVAFTVLNDDGAKEATEPSAVPKDFFMKRACELPPAWVQRINRGYRGAESRHEDIVIVPTPPNYVGGFETTSHSGPYDFLQQVPLVFYGPGIVQPQGRVEVEREVTVADLAPTYAELMDYDFPRRHGRPLTEILPAGTPKPKLIFTAVIDGGGWNALEQWPNAWPHLARMIENGVNVEGAIVGSSPSVTPATHTTMSAGDFPKEHGVTGILVRNSRGAIVGGFTRDLSYAGAKTDPDVSLRLPTLADLYDRALDNAPLVGTVSFGNYTAGLIGHGAALKGGDKDFAAFEEEREWATDPRWYSMPPYLNAELPGPEGDLEATDLLDGQADGLWRGHEIAPLDATPAFAPFENRAIKALIEREGFGTDDTTDLFYVNYKAPDTAGHQWNMINPEQHDVLASVDEALGDLEKFFDAKVGRGNYLMVVTADHGQTPLEVGGWAVDRAEIIDDVNSTFDHTKNARGLIEKTSPTLLFMSDRELKINDVTAEKISSYLSRYTLGDNVGNRDDNTPPKEFADRTSEPIFDAVFPEGAMPEIVACTGAPE